MHAPSITIRAATLGDLPEMTAIYNHYVEHTHITFDIRPLTPAEREPWFHAHCDGRRHQTFAAFDGTRMLGYAGTGAFRPKQAYETTVEVTIACHPSATGMGVGSRLYEALFAALAHEDVHRAVAGIAQPNVASMRLHERFGFERVGVFTEVGRKFGRYWDVVWLEKRLAGAAAAPPSL